MLERVINTPSVHRVHHARNPRYIDRNYAGVLTVWDHLFGTFVPEEEAPHYGITRRIATHNPLTLTFHEWRDMFADTWRNRDLRHLGSHRSGSIRATPNARTPAGPADPRPVAQATKTAHRRGFLSDHRHRAGAVVRAYAPSREARLRSCSFRWRLRRRMLLGVISTSSSSSMNSTAYSSDIWIGGTGARPRRYPRRARW